MSTTDEPPATKADIVERLRELYRNYEGSSEDHVGGEGDKCHTCRDMELLREAAAEIERLRTPASIPSDLEERLRRRADALIEVPTGLPSDAYNVRLLREASSALRTLREENARLRQEASATIAENTNHYANLIERAEAEVTGATPDSSAPTSVDHADNMRDSRKLQTLDHGYHETVEDRGQKWCWECHGGGKPPYARSEGA